MYGSTNAMLPSYLDEWMMRNRIGSDRFFETFLAAISNWYSTN
jgi:hypothetical protein